jgi:hypothetical protein
MGEFELSPWKSFFCFQFVLYWRFELLTFARASRYAWWIWFGSAPGQVTPNVSCVFGAFVCTSWFTICFHICLSNFLNERRLTYTYVVLGSRILQNYSTWIFIKEFQTYLFVWFHTHFLLHGSGLSANHKKLAPKNKINFKFKPFPALRLQCASNFHLIF